MASLSSNPTPASASTLLRLTLWKTFPPRLVYLRRGAFSSFFADDIIQAIRNQIAEAQKIASGNGSEQDIAEAKIELEVCLLFPPSGLFALLIPFLQVLETLQAHVK